MPRNTARLRRGTRASLSPQRRRFALEYLRRGNATEAAIVAGYSPKTAKVQASRLLTFVDVQRFLAGRVAKLELEADRVLGEVARQAFEDIPNIVDLFDEHDNLRPLHTLTLEQQRSIAGLEHPTSGTIRIGETTVFSSDTGVIVPAEKRKVGMVFQSYAVWPHMTVRQNVVYPLKHRKIGRADAGRKVDDVLALAEQWQTRLAELADLLAAFHAAQPLAPGMPRESARSKLQLSSRVYNALVHYGAQAGVLMDEGETVRAPSHHVRLNAEQQRDVAALLAQCRAQPFNTPSVKDCRVMVSDAVYDVLLRQGQLVQVSTDVVFLQETYDDAIQQVHVLIRQHGQVTAAQARDAFNTTRKYALALLEHLDGIGVQRDAGPIADRRQFADRLQDARLVVAQKHADQAL